MRTTLAAVTCPACGGELGSWLVAPGAEPADPRHYPLARCESCRTAVTGGEPPAPQAHDAGAYRPGAPRLSRLAAPALAAFDRRRLKLLRGAGVARGARLLDVGAGRGRFVAAARAAGYDASGVEPSQRGVEAAREVYGVPLEQATIDSADLVPASLDAVCLWHVLEHVEDPGAAIARVARWLAPGGVVLIGVPSLASLQARLGGAHWYHLDLPRHRTHFTPSGIERLLARAGLEKVGVHHVLAEHNQFGMWQSLVNRVTPTPSYLYNLLKRNVALRPGELGISVLCIALLPFTALLEIAAGIGRRGGAIAVVARRG